MTQVYLNYLYVAFAIIAVASLLLWWGWRGRRRRQADLPEPAAVSEEIIDAEPLAAGEGMVIGTVKAADYLDRIAVHELGLRTDGRLEVHEQGVAVFRAGARNFLITRDQVTHTRTDRGVVGKFVERDGALIIGWMLGDEAVETAFRARHAESHEQLLSHLTRLTEE
ncbi:PH-like domain-containing protein [Nesterenkonia suensis]